jgi:hypothetical protein
MHRAVDFSLISLLLSPRVFSLAFECSEECRAGCLDCRRAGNPGLSRVKWSGELEDAGGGTCVQFNKATRLWKQQSGWSDVRVQPRSLVAGPPSPQGAWAAASHRCLSLDFTTNRSGCPDNLTRLEFREATNAERA